MTDAPAGAPSSRLKRNPQWTRYNPPGQPVLFYRPDAYHHIVARMLDELRNQKVMAQNQGEDQPLIHFNTLAVDDWTVAFLRAWATVSAVLSFYQERIINEGYLRTTTERRSVLELTRAVGYELSPPVAATTHLAFMVQESASVQEIRIPRGTDVQSVPAPFSSTDAIQDIIQGQAGPTANLPVTFETIDDLIAHPDWNALTPARVQGLAWPGKNKPGRTLRLAGSSLGLKPGDLLLIAGQAESTTSLPAWELLQLNQVDSQAKDGYTAVRWERVFGSFPEEDIAHPSVYVFRRKTALFPYVAGAVFRKTDLGWAPTNIGLPPKPVQAATASSEGRLYVAIEQAIYSSSDRGDSWQPVASAQPPKDEYALDASLSGAVAAGGADGGVHVYNDGGASWSPLSGPGEVEILTGWRRFFGSVRYKLPKTNIRSLLFAEKDGASLLAGSDDGVFGYDARRDSWVSMNERMPGLDRKKGTAPLAVRALAAVNGGKRILAGTDNGVFPVEALFNGPSNAVLAALLGLLMTGTLNTVLPDFLSRYSDLLSWLVPIGVLIVLLFWQQPFRQKWVGFALAIELSVILGFYSGFNAHNSDTGLVIDFTVFNQTVILLASTFLALNVLRAGFAKLPGLIQKLPDWVKGLFPGVFNQAKQPMVFSLLVVGSEVYAGTDHGVYKLERQNLIVRFVRWWQRLFLGPQPEPWSEMSNWSGDESPADRVVSALALDTRDNQDRLLAGTRAGNLYERNPETKEAWAKVDMPLASIRAILTAKGDVFAMGAPLDAPQEVRWAPAQLEAGAVDLDALSLKVPTGSFAAAIDGDSAAVFQMTGAVEQASHDAKQAGHLTRVTIRDKEILPDFNRASTQFFCQSERLALFDDQFLPHLVRGKEIVLAGQAAGLEEAEDKVMLIAGKTPQGKPCSELITITKAVSREEMHQKTTIIQLKDELESDYDRDSVTIYGNIVQAIQGQTIRNESLGESDGTIPNQRFLLRNPLAYEPDGSDYKSSLVVQVNQIQWNQVSSLLDQPAGARVYMVRRNDQGQTAIIFGDGEQGASLPTSREILTATYRSGGGEAGNVSADSLTMLQSHLPYVKKVTNPAPAKGGLPPESAGHGREQAPKRVRALGRIVTLKDHADFTATLPGVSQSAVRALPEQAPRQIEIAIVPKHDPQADLAHTAPLLTELEIAIRHSRSSAILPVKLHFYRPVFFSLGMQLHLSAEMRTDKNRQNHLVQAVRKKILGRYSLEMQILGGAVLETEIFQQVQSVHGIIAVTLTRLQKVASASEGVGPASPASSLTADWDELLLLKANDFVVEVSE